jgi:hypothetical protein
MISMKKKWIGLASVIPGLGYWVLGERRKAITIALIVFGLGIFSFLTPSDTLFDITSNTAILIWVVQMTTAEYSAHIIDELRIGSGRPAKLNQNIHTSQSLSTVAWHRRGILKKVLGEVPDGDDLMHAIGGATHYIGLTTNKLFIIKPDAWGKPAITYEFPRNAILAVYYEKGSLYDGVAFDFGARGHADISVGRAHRKTTLSIVDEIKTGIRRSKQLGK